MKRRLIALVLVISLVASLSVTAFAGNAEDKKEIIYVSIGDSMTNGYGLDGYDGESGIMNYGKDVYSNQFAAWLAGYEGEIADDQTVFVGPDGTTVDHRQLAMSGMRAEDLAWLLQLNCPNDTYAQDLVIFKQDPARSNVHWNQNGYGKYCPRCNKVHIHGWEYEWGGGREYWYSHDVTDPAQVIDGYGFTSGDWRTWTDLLDPDYRLADGAAKILSMYGKDGFGFESNSVNITTDMVTNAQNGLNADKYYPGNGLTDSKNLFGAEGKWLRFVSEFYQDSVADADVITLALGNTNFGTFMFDSIKDIFLKPTAKSWFPSRYHIDEVKLMAKAAGVDDELMNMIEDLINEQINPILDEQFATVASQDLPTEVVDGSATDPYDLLKTKTKGALIKYIVNYCVLSYIVSYIDSLNQIVELNEKDNVDIIQIALMNAYKTANDSNEMSDDSFASIIDKIYVPVNAFIAMMPEYLADKNPEAYENATFYYADAGTVQTLSEVFGNDFYVGTDRKYISYPGLDLNNDGSANPNSVIRDRIQHWISGRHDGRDKVYSKHYFTGPGGDPSSGEIWKHVLDKFTDANRVAVVEGTDVVWQSEAINGCKNESPYTYYKATNIGRPDFFGVYDLMYITYQDLVDFAELNEDQIRAKLTATGTDEATKIERDWAFSIMMYLAFEDATIRSGKKSFDLKDISGATMDIVTFAGAFETFAKWLYDNESVTYTSIKTGAVPADKDIIEVFEQLSDALYNDDTASTFLCLTNRMQIGTGIGGHPSEGGHADMFEAIKRDYAAKNTGEEVTKNFLLSYLTENYPNLMDKLTGAEGAGDMDDLAIIIQMLKMSDNAALEGVDLDELEAEIRDTLRAYEKAHTAEEAEEAQAAADTLYLKLYALAAAVTGTQYEPNEKSFYVSLGDSNVNGYGLPGYDADKNGGYGQNVEGAAPVELAKKIYGADWEKYFGQYAMGSLRSEDMLYLLGDERVVIDDYYTDEVQWRVEANFGKDIKAAQDAYIAAIEKADLISIALGGGNVTTFTGEQVDRVLAGETLVKMDWKKIGYEDDALVELDEMLDTMVPLMDAMGMMDKYLPEGMGNVSNPAAFARTLLESVLYGYASYNYYYPMVLERIREINPDAHLVILGMSNPVDDWSTTVNFDGEDMLVNIGGIAGNLMESANLQNLAYALQNDNTTFVDVSETETILDDLVQNYPDQYSYSFEAYYNSILMGNGLDAHASADGHAYMYEQMLTALSGEGYDEELKDLGQLVYEALCDDYLTTREKLNILGEAYATAKHEGVLKQNREIAVAEEIYEYLDDAGYIGDNQILEIIKYVLGCALDGEIAKLALADYIIEVLGENEDLTDADRVAMIGNIYTILEEAGYLADYEADLSLLEDLHAELKDYLTDKQSVAIVEAIYDALTDDGEMSDEEKIAIAQFVYELVLVDGNLSYEDRVDAIVGVYGVLKTKGYLAGYEKEMAVVEELVAHEAMKKVPAEQAFAIVDYIYDAVCDGDVDAREMLGYIYFEVLKAEAPAAEAFALLAVGDPILSAADKLAIVEAVYEIMDKYYDLESTPNLKAIKDLYDNLDPLMSDELALSIIDLTVAALVENETLGEEEITEVAAEIADKLLAEDSELSHEAKAAVLREVTNALKSTDLGETEIGGAVIPALDVIDELRTELEAYLSDEQVGEIIEIVYSFVKENDTLTEKQKAQLADEIYTIVLNREDLTAEDKIEIITIIYTVLDEHDYVDANVTIAYMKAYAAAKEKGYIDDAALALDAVKGIVELAKDYVDMYPGSEELKALLLEELDNTEETLDALIGLLDNEVLDEDAWAEMKALEDELNKHIETITELAEAMGVELDGCIADLEDAAKVYADMIAEVAEAAYDYAVESIEGFADDYAEWVESVGDEIDEVNPVLGDAVRKFLTEVPADALSILYAYGDEAVAKLVSEAVKAYGDMETVIADLAYVLNTYGEEIYEAVKGNDEIETLIEDIKDQLAEVKDLVEWINDHPFEGAYNASVADKEAALQTAYDQLVYLYNRLYDVAMSVIADVDEEAAEALEAALDALQEVLSIAGESAEGYLGWLADHGEAMGCALLTALLDNIEELLTTACPIVDELIWALLAQVDQAILEFLPVADQWMYDWLYNNPDKVIAFFTEYGEEIGELAEEYGEYVVGILGYIAYTYGPEVLEYVIENPEEALEQFVAWYDKYGYRVWPMIDVYLEELGVYDAIEDGAEAVIEKIEEALEELGVQLESEIRDLIDEKLDDATHGEYTVTADSYYVAIDEMYGEDEEGYADKLAEHLGIDYTEINELDEDEIAKADLITVRYNNEPMIGVMIEDAKDYKTVEAKDWSVYVGEVGAEYVQQALAEVKAMLAEQDLGTMSDMALVAVESYAYEYVGHMINYIQDLETISEINPDALVISVGMNNALADVVLTLDEEEVALGEYIQYVVDAANLEAFVYVLVTGNAIYVDAPAVETEFDAEESADVMDFILNLIDEESREVLLANDEGHEYIKEQILGALTITYEGLLGDANSDGIVDYVDAIYVLEYDAKLRTADELAYGLCDVNGDGAVDYVDAIFILEYDAKLIDKFPAAV